MKTCLFVSTFFLATIFSANASASLLRCENGNDAGVKASGTFFVTNRCDTGYALKNSRTGKLNCLSVSRDFSNLNGWEVDVCVVETADGLVIVDMRPKGAE